jgi:hypothetical protein
MGKPSDRDKNYMYELWGTTNLTSDYGIFDKIKDKKMLREINNDDLTPKKHDFFHQNEIHSKIRNDEDYDDWEYGTEPLYESKNSDK